MSGRGLLAIYVVVISIAAAPFQSAASVDQGIRKPPADPHASSRLSSPLRRIADIRRLGPADADRALAVTVQGVVTALPGFKNSFFVQDETDAIGVDRTEDADDVRPGDIVSVVGTSSSGLFIPSIVASKVVVLGHRRPPAPLHVDYDDLVGGAQDSRWIEVDGIVRSAHMGKAFGHDELILIVHLTGGPMRVIFQDFAGIDYTRLIDATVRLRGLCATNFNAKRQFVGVEMYVPRRSDMDILSPAPGDPFAAPALPVRTALQFGQGQHRVRVGGVVTFQVPGQTLYLQDGSDGIEVQTSQKDEIPPGSRVEAVGFPAIGGYAPVLEDGVVRVLGPGKPIPPLKSTAHDMIVEQKSFTEALLTYAPFDGQLVQLTGNVVENHIQGDKRVWILRHDNDVFEAHLSLAASDARMAAIAAGSVLSVTGICAVHADAERTPISFHLLLRSSADVEVIRSAPWWNPKHGIELFAGLAGAIVLILLWVYLLRRRVEQQTQTIRDSEQRFRYLAEHDGLTGLLNRTAVISALDRAFSRVEREPGGIAIVLGDIDHFKRVNDTYGHLAGDAALRHFADVLSGAVRPYDSVGRYGGEEFLIVLGGISEEDVQERVTALHCDITNLSVEDGPTRFQFTCSLGAVFVCGEEHSKQGDSEQRTTEEPRRNKALAAADEALYEAKQSGRNRVIFKVFSQQTVFSAGSCEDVLPPGVPDNRVGVGVA